MVISIISEGLCEILDNDLKDEGAPRHVIETYATFPILCSHPYLRSMFDHIVRPLSIS
jgi:hypothetical protein